MKTLIMVALTAMTLASSASADDELHFLWADFGGNFGDCVNDKGIPLCAVDGILGH